MMRFFSCKETISTLTVLFVLLLVMVNSLPITAQDPPLVRVQVFQERIGEKIAYHYRITNNSKDEIVMIDIGFNFTKYQAELSVYPLGYNTNSPLTNQNARSPEGWKVRVIHQEENDKYFLEWEILTNTRRGILAGQTLEGFTIILPREDISFTRGHFDVIFRNSTRFSGVIESSTTPPGRPGI